MYRTIFLITLFALSASAARARSGGVLQMAQKCAKESGINIMQILLDPSSIFKNFDTKIKCLGACAMKEFGILKAGGTLDLDMVSSKLPTMIPGREMIIDALADCADIKGANDCETAYKIGECIVTKQIVKFF